MYDEKRVRLSVPVTEEVHQVFTRMAKAAGLPLGRTMADWLQDTMEGAQFVAAKMEEARAQPRQVLREMRALSVGMTHEADALLGRVSGRRAHARPPSSNTGGKSPEATKAPRAKKGVRRA